METDENMVPKLEEMKAKFESLDQNQISHIELVTPKAKPSEDIRTFAIIEYTGRINEISNRSKSDDDVFTMVDDTATPQGGMPAFFNRCWHESYTIHFRQGEWVLKVWFSLSSLSNWTVRLLMSG